VEGVNSADQMVKLEHRKIVYGLDIHASFHHLWRVFRDYGFNCHVRQ